MSLLDDFKKLLFGAKSATRSAADKIKDTSEEIGESVRETGTEFFKKAKSKSEELSEQAGKSVDHLKEKYDKWIAEVSRRSEKFEENVHERCDEATEEADDRLEELRQKAEEFRKELADESNEHVRTDLSEKMEALEKEKEAIRSDLKQKAEEIKSEAEELRENVREEIRESESESEEAGQRLKDSVESVGASLLSGMAGLLEKFQDSANTVAGKMEKKSEEIQRKASAFLHEKDEHGQSIADRVKAKMGRVKDSLKDTMDKAQKAAEETIKGKESPYRSSEEDLERLRKSELDDKDEFWRKADEYASGNYDRVKEVKIEKAEDSPAPTESTGTVKGFIDEDGDGNEIIDDAVIEEE